MYVSHVATFMTQRRATQIAESLQEQSLRIYQRIGYAQFAV